MGQEGPQGAIVRLSWVNHRLTVHDAPQALEIVSGRYAGYIIGAIVPNDRTLETRLNKILDDGSGV